jgi:hypothetical protein
MRLSLTTCPSRRRIRRWQIRTTLLVVGNEKNGRIKLGVKMIKQIEDLIASP